MWSFIERKLHQAAVKRQAAEAYQARLDAAPICQECEGEGQKRVRGVRSPTGFETCCHCGGSGKDLGGNRQ